MKPATSVMALVFLATACAGEEDLGDLQQNQNGAPVIVHQVPTETHTQRVVINGSSISPTPGTVTVMHRTLVPNGQGGFQSRAVTTCHTTTVQEGTVTVNIVREGRTSVGSNGVPNIGRLPVIGARLGMPTSPATTVSGAVGAGRVSNVYVVGGGARRKPDRDERAPEGRAFRESDVAPSGEYAGTGSPGGSLDGIDWTDPDWSELGSLVMTPEEQAELDAKCIECELLALGVLIDLPTPTAVEGGAL